MPCRRLLAAAAAALAWTAGPAGAEPSPRTVPTPLGALGGVGLITVPSARTLSDGEAAVSVAGDGRQRHVSLTVQALPRIEAVLRYSEPGGWRRADPGPVIVGGDVKAVLLREDRHRPQLAAGLRGLGPDSRLRGEFIALSKRYRAADLTLGIGWGRLAGAGSFPNPLTVLHGRFGQDRRGQPLGDLLGGRTAGVFGGLTLDTPLAGLALLAEFGPPLALTGPVSAHGSASPAPMGVGLSWEPRPWLQAGLAVEPGRRVTARASLRFGAGDLPLRAAVPAPHASADFGSPDGPLSPSALLETLAQHGLPVRAVERRPDELRARLDDDPHLDISRSLGRTARLLNGLAAPGVERFRITLQQSGLPTAEIDLLRDDIDRAVRHAGSTAEIWRTARLAPASPSRGRGGLRFRLEPRLEVDPLPESGTPAGRASLVGGLGLDLGAGVRLGLEGRLNGASSLPPTADAEPGATSAVRRDRGRFAAASRLGLERLDLNGLGTTGELFVRAGLGVFEEALLGLDAEALWRPFRGRVALGAQVSALWRRDPETFLGIDAGPRPGAFLDVHFRPGLDDVSARLSLGRYLAGDLGATLAGARRFGNGLTVGAFVTATDAAEPPTGHIDLGVRLTVPLQFIRGLPSRASAQVTLRPLTRDAGQRLEHPLALQPLTDPGSFAEIARTWPGLLR